MILNHYGTPILLCISAANLALALAQRELDQCISYLSKLDLAGSAVRRYVYWHLAIIDRVVQGTQVSHMAQLTSMGVVHMDRPAKRACDWVLETVGR
jgi:hypothetical protein